MMSSKRDSDCCWTCRLRRKKCDRSRPICGGCQRLGIACHRNAQRPDWMDGGEKQQRMSQSVKKQIRQNAERRRERVTDSSCANDGLNFVVEPQNAATSSQLAPGNDFAGQFEIPPERTHSGLNNAIYPISSFSDDPAALEHFETAFLTKYLDDVFPFLFPSYRPSIMETGRYWILSLFKYSDVARHAALSLSAYFLTVCMQETHQYQFEACKDEMWQHLGQQTNGYFKRIQDDVERQIQSGEAAMQERARSMQSIMQALLFEVFLGRSSTWNVHLTAALSLFDEMRCTQTKNDATPTFMSLLVGLGKPAWYTPEIDTYIWNTEQAGFRFCTALLIFLDVIGSTATEQRPRLLDHYPLLLADVDEGEESRQTVSLQLSEYIGCQNWVIVAIAKTAALAKWKMDAKKSGSLSVMELAERAKQIEEILNRGMQRVANRRSQSANTEKRTLFSSYGRPSSPVSSETTTEIWAEAARLYLTVVVSGWQPRNTTIRDGVHRILTLLQSIKSPSHLHAVKWPFVVAGCLTDLAEEQRQFTSIIQDGNEMGMYGTLTEVQKILLRAWETRGMCKDHWDFASCFRILGYQVLLF